MFLVLVVVLVLFGLAFSAIHLHTLRATVRLALAGAGACGFVLLRMGAPLLPAPWGVGIVMMYSVVGASFALAIAMEAWPLERSRVAVVAGESLVGLGFIAALLSRVS